MEIIMNFLPLGKTTLKATLATVLLASLTGTAMADEARLQFSVESNATRSIRSAATAFEKGQFSKSASFSNYALKQGLKKSRKTAALSNLCAALGAQGEYDEAMEACNKAIDLAPQNWHALSNRAVIYSLTGNEEKAREDMQAAILLASDEPKLAQNQEILG
jgi:Flp pilus assembly protein TadD